MKQEKTDTLLSLPIRHTPNLSEDRVLYLFTVIPVSKHGHRKCWYQSTHPWPHSLSDAVMQLDILQMP